MRVIDDVAAAVRDAKEGDGRLIHAAVAQHAEGHGHFHRRYAAGAQRQAEGRFVDVLIRYAQRAQDIGGVLRAHIVHQRIGRGGVVAFYQRGAQRFGAAIAGTAVVLGPGGAAVAVQIPLDGQGHVVHHGAAAQPADFNGRGVHRDGLDGRAHGHVHIRGAVERFAAGGLRAAAHNGF